MNFKDIYEEFLNGKKIRRKSWKEGSWININNIKVLGKESLTAEDWEIVEEKEEKIWWEPEWHEDFWSIESNGEVGYNCYIVKAQTEKITFGNCFQTEEQAKFMAETLKVITKIRKYIAEKGQIEPHVIATRYYIYYNPLLKEVRVGVSQGGCGISSPFNLYFHSNQDAEECIKLIGKENLKKYYFGIEE